MSVDNSARLALESDPRWRRLHDRSWVCPCCGEAHGGPFDLAADHPAYWHGQSEKQPISLVLTSDDFLSADFCIMEGKYHFVRCTLELSIVGAEDEIFAFGVWSSLSKTNFVHYCETFDSEIRSDLGPWFGWFSNRLRGYPDTVNLKCRVHPRDGRRRPTIELEPTDHPLSREQRDGITFERLLDIYAAHGHDLRAALTD